MYSLTHVLLTGGALGIALGLIFSTVYAMSAQRRGGSDSFLASDFPHTAPLPVGRVDPWELQRELMRISGQQMAKFPMLTKDVLLYYAMILEEVAEAGETLHKIIQSHITAAVAQCVPLPLVPGANDLSLIAQAIDSSQRAMGVASRRVRQHLVGLKEWSGFELTLKQAVRLLDDTSDVQVVNSGFALAAGLPGAEGFRAASESNLSKKNPDTGLIDKDPSGKWIKGRDYVPPNLADVLILQYPWLDQTDVAPVPPAAWDLLKRD